MVKLTLVEAFSAMRRWNDLPVETQVSLLDPDTKSYTAQVISTNPDEFITVEFMLNNRFTVDSNLVGAWELFVASNSWFACTDPMADDPDMVKFIKDASHFKRYTSVDAKLWK